ncbi:MAG: FliM/FliN family flagellar motor C-terminal domain-containing protein [Legionellales bacterium]
MKPYRLINSKELHTLQQQVDKVLEHWNDTYSIEPLRAQLFPWVKSHTLTDSLAILQNQKTQALMDRHYLSVMNQAVFNTDAPCFNSASQELFISLINQLFDTNNCSIQNDLVTPPNWFYKGTTCLRVSLSCASSNCSLILNPDWVYQQLPNIHLSKSKPSSLEAALGMQQLDLNLELIPVLLPLKQILALQKGDVIATDHALTKHLRLTQNQFLIAEAQLAPSECPKSIIIKRFS